MKTSNYKIIKETEKAINVELPVIVGGRGKQITWKFWIPKSAIEIVGNEIDIAQWCIGPKTMEIRGFVAFA